MNKNKWRRVRGWPKWVAGTIYAIRRRWGGEKCWAGNMEFIVTGNRQRFEYKIAFGGFHGEYDAVWRRLKL